MIDSTEKDIRLLFDAGEVIICEVKAFVSDLVMSEGKASSCVGNVLDSAGDVRLCWGIGWNGGNGFQKR